MFVQVINVTFNQSSQNSLQIVCGVHELQIINSAFIGGRNDVDINITGTVLKAILRSTTFSHNRIGSLISYGSLNKSYLYIQNCNFSKNIMTDFGIQLYSFNSVVIESSYFEENYANEFILAENVINVSIACTCFHRNIARNGSVLNLRSDRTIAASLFFHSSFVINNTANLSDGGILSMKGMQILFRNCVFQGNVVTGSGSTLTISESFLTVINMTVFKENEASLEGGAITGKSILFLYICRSNFTKNVGNRCGALNITGEAIAMSNCYINSNIAKGYSGALQIHGQIVKISGSHCFNNTAHEGNGGAINITSDALQVVSSNFSSNRARSGGAISISKGYQIFNNTMFERNHAARSNSGAMASALVELEEIVSNYSKIINNSDAVSFTVGFSTFNNNSAECSGGAISSTGIVIDLESSNFSSNIAVFDGGALLLDIKSVVINWCIFLHNSAEDEGGAIRFSGNFLSINQSFFFENEATAGGALSFFNINQTKINSSQFIYNEAHDDGSAIDINEGIALEIYSCNFYMNKIVEYGGAIDVDSLLTFAMFETKFTTNFNGAVWIQNTRVTVLWKCFFYNNTSNWGYGTVHLVKESVKFIFIENCVFKKNSAEMGSAITFSAFADSFSTIPCGCSNFFDMVDHIIDEISTAVHQKVVSKKLLHDKSNYFNLTMVINSTFSYNTAKYPTSSGGAISVQGNLFNNVPKIKYSDYDRLLFIGCAFIGNSAHFGGGIYFHYSKAFVKNTLFHNNNAQCTGGGITFKQSEICFSGNVSFIANKVISKQGKGGALYSNDEGINCEELTCAVLWTNQSILRFVNNIATEGPALFGGMLNQCNRTESLESAFKRIEFDNMPYIWNSYTITSSGIKLCLDFSCKRDKIKNTVSPGQSFTVTVACLDQMELPLNNCVVKSDGYESAMFLLGRGEYQRTINGFEQLTFHLYSNIINSTSLIIYSDLICSDNIQNIIEVLLDVQPCPRGLYLDKMECTCDYRLKSSFKNIECNITNESIFTGSGWLAYRDNYLRMNSKCPINYCRKQRTFMSPLQPDVQCADNRSGVLCGGCLANYSVALGSWKCMECSHTSRYNFIWLTVAMALAGVVLVVFLWLVKMTVSVGTINGMIFYANIVSFSGLLDNQNCAIHPFLHVFISWINLDLGIEVCFYSGMDAYQKTWLQFVFPFYIWFLVGVIILVCNYSSTVMKLMGMRNIEVLATLFLLSYTKLLKTIVTALSVTNIMVASADNRTDPLRPHKVWVYDGNIDYFGSKHLPLLIVAVLFLFVLFMPYTLFLLCGHWLQYAPRKRGFLWIHSTLISTIVDAYHAPYTKHHRYWTGLGLLIRCCLFTIFGTTNSSGINILSITMAVILLQVIRIASSVQLYRNKVVGLLELFYLSNLGILTTILLINDTLCMATTVSISLSFIVFVGTLVYHLNLETRKNSLIYQRIKKRFNNCSKKCKTSRL